MRFQIVKALSKVTGIMPDEIRLEVPEREEFGDYSTNVALVIFSLLKNLGSKRLINNTAIEQFDNRSPQEIALEIVKKLKTDKKLQKVVGKIEVAGQGFINFWLKEGVFIGELAKISKENKRYGQSDLFKGKNLMVEYAHPNTHKEFHIGHLRNISIGEAVSRLLEACGGKVIRVNYQGDVGLHVAKALWGVEKLGLPKARLSISEKAKFLGMAYAKGARAYEDDADSKKEIDEINIAIYKKDRSVIKVWETTRRWSLEYFAKIYKRLGTKYDRLYFESEVVELGIKIAEDALKKGVLEKSKGAVVFKGDKYNLDTRVFLTKAGLPTYEAKELGLAKLEFSEFGKIDKLIHVVAPEQTSFFEVTFMVEELLDAKTYKNKQHHLKYGFVHLKEGKMSSREGVVLTGPWLLDEAKKRLLKILEKTDYSDKEKDEIAEIAAIGAVKYLMLLPGLTKDIYFDIDESLNLEGNSGPYLQYTYTRTQSLLRKSKISNKRAGLNLSVDIESLDINKEEKSLLRSFIHFPEVVAEAADKYAPNLICNYIFDLAQKFNLFYQKHRILEGDKLQATSDKLENMPSTGKFRLALALATGQILKNGLYLLGVATPERM